MKRGNALRPLLRTLRDSAGKLLKGLRAAATAVGVTTGTDDEIAARLIDWRHDYQQDLTKLDRALEGME